MKRAKRILLRVLVTLLSLFVALWIFVWAYVTYNKAGIIRKVKASINKQISDKVDIGDVSIDFFHNFPNVSVKLSNVTIRDSLWEIHHHDFLKAGAVYARLRLFSVFSGSPALGKVIVENAQVYLFTDSSEYSNIVKIKKNEDGKTKNSAFPELVFKNTRVIIDHPSHHKFHDIELNELECKSETSDSGRSFKININALVHKLAFNDSIGSYLREKQLNGTIRMFVNKEKNVTIDKAALVIDHQPFDITGAFMLGNDPKNFRLSIKTKNINFKKAIGLLTERTQKNFEAYEVKNPVDIESNLNGLLAYRSIPLAKVTFIVRHSDLETAAGKFNDCSFVGNFTNEVDPSKPRLNENSMLSLNDFSCKWQNLPIDSKSLVITNLTSPFVKCDVHSLFSLPALNELTGSNSIQLTKGSGEASVHYEGSLVSNDTTATFMNGNIKLRDAEVNYVPRNITLRSLAGDFVFRDKDLFIQQLHAQAGSTALNMSGSIRNLIGLIYKDPDKLVLDWNISTPGVDLVDFLSFLGKKSHSGKKASVKSRVTSIADKVDRMLENGTARLSVQAGRVKYKNFIATNVSTSLSLVNDQVLLHNASLNHAGGSIIMSGTLQGEGSSNAVTLKSNINNVDIPTMLRAFDNFGQDAVTAQNMKGRLTAIVNMNTGLTERGGIRSNSMASTVDFSLKDAELNDFEPFKKIAVSVFKKRDFSHVRFAELKDKFVINGTAINVGKMEIRSNVFTMFVEGVYDTKKGTDMNIVLPLSNLKKVDDDEILVNKGKAGLHVNLHAKTGDDGKLKISWNPLGGLFKKKKSS